MIFAPHPAAHPAAATYQRLLLAAVDVFAEHGYHNASTREICRRAGANSAAIHYHFGDKASLYREVFRFGFSETEDGLLALSGLPRREALEHFYRALLAPLAGSALHQRLLRLHAREEIEPSGVLGDTVAQAIGPRHARLTAFIVRELGLTQSDLEVQRLAFALVGMGAMFYHLRHVITELEPRLTAGPEWLDAMTARLADYAFRLIDAEAMRRDRRRVEDYL